MRMSLSGSDWEVQGWLAHEWELIKNVKVDAGNLDLAQVMFGETDWMPATVPGAVHADLVRAGVIADPYVGMNSRLCEWVHDRMWLYRKTFTVPVAFAGRRLRLGFEGMDYGGRVFLDGALLGRHEGTFIPVEFDITGKVAAGSRHELLVMVDIPPYEPGQVGYCQQVRTLRPRFTSGWDFCTRLVNVGLWGDVWLEASGPVVVEDLFALPQQIERTQAVVHCSAALRCAEPTACDWRWQILRNGREVAAAQGTANLPAGRSPLGATVAVPAPELWWPNGMGEQPLYELRLEVRTAKAVSHEATTRFGIRALRMVANEGAPAGAPPYTAEINGRRVFLKGWNWVPLDHLYGAIAPEKYAWFLDLVKRAGANCLRVWGGGIIEPEIFYRLCDEAGLLVLQEMPQSSSGLDNEPPRSAEFLARLRDTVRAALRARRNHPCLFAIGGGNELTYDGLRPLDAQHPNLVAIRETLEQEAPHLAWFPTSPFGPSFDIRLNQVGKGLHHDVHGPWKYQGLEAHYDLFNRNDCLFHSEVGAEACTRLESIHRFLRPDQVWPPRKENRAWLHHAHWWVQWNPVTELFGEQREIGPFIAASQLVQAEALRYALEANRRRAFACSATLLWQFSEPWPNATATSVVDYYGAAKLGYYAAARAMRPRLASLAYDKLAWSPGQEFSGRVFLHNEGRSGRAKVTAQMVDVTGRPHAEAIWTVQAAQDSVQHPGALALRLPDLPAGVFFVRLEADFDGKVIENTYAFSLKPNIAPFLALPRTVLEVTRDGRELVVRNAGSAIAWTLTAGRPDGGAVHFDGTGSSLMPGESRRYAACTPPADAASLVEIEVGAYNAAPVKVRIQP